MVISLDNEISQFEPFGRNVISSVPEHKNRQANNNENDDLLTLAHHLHNDFTAAELDNTRDLCRSLNDVSISKEGSFVQVTWPLIDEGVLMLIVLFCRGNFGGCENVPKAKKNCM